MTYTPEQMTIAALVHHAGKDQLFLRTGTTSEGEKKVYIDSLVPNTSQIRLRRPINIDYSYYGERRQCSISVLDSPTGYVFDCTKEHLAALHEVYGARVRELVDIDKIFN